MIKDPDATLPFAADWAEWLANESDTVASFTWIVPDGLVNEAEATSGAKSTIWLSGGELGMNYNVISRITTTGGRVDDRTLTIHIRER